MSGKGVLPMDSYRLAQYSVQVPCFICEGGNSFDAEVCRHCQAPMALGTSGESAEDAAAIGGHDRFGRRGQDRLSGHADRYAVAWPRRSAAAGPRCVLGLAAAADHLGSGELRVPRQDAQRTRPLELDSLPGPSPRTNAIRPN